MLKYKIKNNFNTTFEKVEFDDLYVSPDLTFISATTGTKYNLNTCSELLLKTDLDVKGTYMPMEAFNFTYLGFVLIPTKYEVKEYKIDENNNVQYVTLGSGKIYYSDSYGNEQLENTILLPSPLFMENNKIIYDRYKIVDGYVNYYDLYYITDDEIISNDGTIYEVFVSHDLVNGLPETKFSMNEKNSNKKLNLEELVVDDNFVLKGNVFYYNIYETPKEKTKIIIKNIDNPKISVDFISCCQISSLINYQDEVKKIRIINEKEDDVVDLEVNVNNNTNLTTDVSSVENKVIIDDSDKSEMKQYYTYKDSDSGSFIHLYLRNNNIQISDTNIINAASKNGDIRTVILNNDANGTYLFHNGKKYFEKELDDKGFYYDFVVLGNDEYKINYISDDEGYINYNGNIVNLKISENIDELTDFENGVEKVENVIDSDFVIEKKVTLKNGTFYNISSNIDKIAYRIDIDTLVSTNINENGDEISIILNLPLYGVKRYSFIDVEGEIFKIETGTTITNTIDEESEDISEVDENYYKFILFNLGVNYRFAIDDIEAPNKIRCHPIIDLSDDNIEKLKIDYEVNTLENSLYQSICYDVSTNYDKFIFSIENSILASKEEFDYTEYYTKNNYHVLDLDTLQIFKKLDYINIHLLNKQIMSTNLNQDDVLGNLFVKNETNKAINSIVDMDKDVYYPCIIKNKKLNNVNKISFTLHFRTRDLINWKINEDYTQGITENEKYIFPSFDKTNTNWFCTDMYDITSASQSGITNCSDLLYYLNFTNNDVFYHKSNISKSFLRLLFYDSMNPDSQSLLYQATVWLDGDKLFKKYITQNSDDKMCKIDDKKYDTPLSGLTVCEKMYVNTEPCEVNNQMVKKLTFDETKRISCSFEIYDRYNSDKSSEGFYLHLFKDLTEGICKRTIYMKVMFNHAGQGVSSLFTVPQIKENGGIDIDNMKQGISISEVLDRIYIPLTVVFDEDTNKFIYYPEDEKTFTFNDNNELNYNLFEIKMKDESVSQKNIS